MLKPKLTIFAVICAVALLLGQFTSMTVIPTRVAAAATTLPLPTEPTFYDEDTSPNQIKGSLDFTPPANEDNTTGYAIYLLDSQGTKLQHLGDVNVKKQQESNAFSKRIGVRFTNYSFPISHLTVPESAVKFGIYPKNANGENDTGVIFPIWDNPRHTFTNLVFTDKNSFKDQVEPELQWKAIDDERLISGYKIYYKIDGTTKELSSNQVDIAKGKTEYSYTVAEGALPMGTTDLFVYAISEEGVQGPGVVISAYDNISEEPIVPLNPSSLIPQPVITDVVDKDSVSGTMAGSVSFDVKDYHYDANDPSSRASVLFYAVYFLDAKKQKLKGIVRVPKKDTTYGYTSRYTAKIPTGTIIPKGAVSIGVFAQMATAEGVLFGEKGFWDTPLDQYQPKEVKFTDLDPLPQSVKAKISWRGADNEEPIYGYAIYLDLKYGNTYNIKPYTIIEKGKKEYEFIFPDGSLKNRGHLIYVLPINEQGEVALNSTAPTFVKMDDTTKGQKASLEPVGLPLNFGYFFEDTDASPGFIGGMVNYNRPDDALALEFFYVDTLNRKRDSIAELDCTGNACYSFAYEIPNGTPIPDGAAYIGVRARMKDNSFKPLHGFAIKDKSSNHPVNFPDLPDKFIGKKEIETIGSMNLIKGYEDGSFGPDKGVTRAEFATMLVNAFHLTSTTSEKTSFSDVSASDWFGKAVAAAVEYKLLSGYEDGTFRPNQLINRSEMASMVFAAYSMVFEGTYTMKYKEYEDNYSIPEWAQGPVSALKYFDIAPKLKKFEPTKLVSRAEAAIMLYRLLENYNLVDRIK